MTGNFAGGNSSCTLGAYVGRGNIGEEQPCIMYMECSGSLT